MPSPRLSLILPVLNEAENLSVLVPRIAAALDGRAIEILVVDDDSRDGTPAVVEALSQRYPVRLLSRLVPTGGLSGAVVHGMAQARGELIVVMDGDLQHPPERIPALLEPIERGEADFVIGSRHVPGAQTHERWGIARALISGVATWLARPLVGGLHDPMSGFFALRRAVYEQARGLRPAGFKIGLELLCRSPGVRAVEVPIDFGVRHAGESKLSVRQKLDYLAQLARLYRFRYLPARARPRGAPARPWLRGALPREVLSPGLGSVLLILLATAVVLRLVAADRVTLVPEEAYYWMYAQHPSLSYFDHPPMVAWMIHLGTALFGHGEFGVRFMSQLAMLASSVLMFLFARAWFGRGAAIASAVLLQALPVYFAAGFIAMMDSYLVLYWLACMIGLTRAVKHGRPSGWYLAGIGFGAALLSKYTAIFLPPAVLMALVVHRPWRRHLRTPHPYLASLLGLAMFSPVLIWNAQHDWASFRFQFIDRYANERFSLKYIGAFLGYQFLVATPLLLVAAWQLARRMGRSSWRLALRPRFVVALAFSLPLLAAATYKGLRYEVHINWTLPLYLSLIPALCQELIVRTRALTRSWQPVPAGWLRQVVPVCLVINIAALVYLVVLQPRVHGLSAFGPWEQLATVVEEHEDKLEELTGSEPLVVADGKYRLASVIAFYRTPIEDGTASALTTSQWFLGAEGLGYEYWDDRLRWSGQTILYVSEGDEHDEILADTKHLFDSVTFIDDKRLNIGRRTYRLAVCRNYRTPPPAEAQRPTDGGAPPTLPPVSGAPATPPAFTSTAAAVALPPVDWLGSGFRSWPR